MATIPKISEKRREQWGPIDARVLYVSFWLPVIARSGITRWRARWFSVYGIMERNRITFVWDRKEMEERGAWAIEHIIANTAVREKAFAEYRAAVRRLREAGREIEMRARKAESDTRFESLKGGAQEWRRLMMEFWDYGVLMEVANFGAPAYLRRKLAPLVPEQEMDGVLETLLAPGKLSFHQQNECALLKIGGVRNQRERRKKLEAHARKWYWVLNSYYESKRLTAYDFEKQLKVIPREKQKERLSSITGYAAAVRRKKRDAIQQYKLPKEIERLAAALSFSIWWQDHRKTISFWAHSITDLFSEAAARTLAIPFDDIMMYRAEEWADLFSRRKLVPQRVIAQRRRFVVFVVDARHNRVTELRGNRARAARTRLLDASPAPAVSIGSIRGIAVCRGKAVGRVCVLFSSRELGKLREGDILVTSMTSPDFVVAMRRASAIVTDVGGLMSHAAVLSRELGKPCIVGTKIATKVLKTGDVVEVDAERGIVTLLGKAEDGQKTKKVQQPAKSSGVQH